MEYPKSFSEMLNTEQQLQGGVFSGKKSLPPTNYKVLDLSISTFQSADATYFHKTIGGYHAAKLKRFQEVVDKQFSGSINQDVLDMLNTKYFITQGKEGQGSVLCHHRGGPGPVPALPRGARGLLVARLFRCRRRKLPAGRHGQIVAHGVRPLRSGSARSHFILNC